MYSLTLHTGEASGQVSEAHPGSKGFHWKRQTCPVSIEFRSMGYFLLNKFKQLHKKPQRKQGELAGWFSCSSCQKQRGCRAGREEEGEQRAGKKAHTWEREQQPETERKENKRECVRVYVRVHVSLHPCSMAPVTPHLPH